MKPSRILLAVLSSLVLCFATVGGNHTISTSKKTSVSSEGTVKSTETTVTQKPDGTIVKEEETKNTTPVRR